MIAPAARKLGSMRRALFRQRQAAERRGDGAFDAVAAVRSAEYYIAAGGDDENPGTSREAAWRSLARVNRHRFRPGDRILLEAGQEFIGPLCLGPDSLGAPDRPIVIDRFGEGRATIRVGIGSAVLIRNLGGVHISNLNVIGGGCGSDSDSGINFVNDLPGNLKLEHIRIRDVSASDFPGVGIVVRGIAGKSGFRDVLIENAEVHGNARNGVCVYGEWSPSSREYAHENVVVRFVRAYDNPGIEGPGRKHSGSGILLSDVNHALIEHCTAFNNGWRCNSLEGGPVGIWAHDSNDVTIQYNESFANRTGGTFDGGGFDLDGGVTNSRLQYNYSHDNEGPGFLVIQYDSARPFEQNVICHNISRNDCRKNSYGAIHVYGNIGSTVIHNNTVLIGASQHGEPAAICFAKGGRPGVQVLRNAFGAGGGALSVSAECSLEHTVFRGNRYESEGQVDIRCGGIRYQSLRDWHLATGHEADHDLDLPLQHRQHGADARPPHPAQLAIPELSAGPDGSAVAV